MKRIVTEGDEVKTMYVYIQSEPGLWTVGFYKPDGTWNPESDYTRTAEAAERVAYLNGGRDETENPYLLSGDELERAEKRARSK